MNAYDWALFRRTLFALGVLLVLAAASVVATDEASSTVGMRLARTTAIVPLLVAVAILGVGSHARARGELRAVEALGVAPWTSLRGAERAGYVVAAASLFVLVAPITDATSLLPVVSSGMDWALAADGSRATAPGVVVFANGLIRTAPGAFASALHRADAWSVVPCLAPIAGVVSPWAASPMALATRAVSGLVTALLAVTGLHLVAAARVPSWVAMMAALPMALSLWRARR